MKSAAFVGVGLGIVAGGAGLAVGRYLQATWPASIGLGVVLGVGVGLLWASGEARNKTGELGRSVVTGALVGLALAGAQSSANRHMREIDDERQAWTDRQSLELTLGTQRSLKGIALSGRDLAFFYLRGREMPGAQLSAADLCRTELSRANLRGANLAAAAMRRTQLVRTKLVHANMWRADLTGAMLFRANLQGSTLREADLRKAVLAEADLRGADLTSAKIDGAEFNDAKYDGATLWPAGSPPEGAVRAAPSDVEPLDIRYGKGAGPNGCFSIVWDANPRP